jgi:phage baseplate assembly protein V
MFGVFRFLQYTTVGAVMFADLKRQIDNLINVGTISQTQSDNGTAMARVKIFDRETAMLPIMSFANSYKKRYVPARVGEQVVVFSPYGDASHGFIVRGLFNDGCPEPSSVSNTKESVEYEDGTVMTYDTDAKKLFIDASGSIEVSASNGMKFSAESVEVSASNGVKFSAAVDIEGSLHVSQGISTDSTVTDSLGDLTNFSTTDGARRA